MVNHHVAPCSRGAINATRWALTICDPSGAEMKTNSLRISDHADAQTDRKPCEPPRTVASEFVFYVANLSREQFTVARRRIARFREFESFDEWDEARRGWQFGLSLAGIDALVVDVDLPLFASGCGEGPLNSAARGNPIFPEPEGQRPRRLKTAAGPRLATFTMCRVRQGATRRAAGRPRPIGGEPASLTMSAKEFFTIRGILANN